ncbi:hypothetical protein HBI56_230700 [Parastagonospora nodorum]|uniref:BTB domain-containing protein n=2 Tax=Phaeosphaeria nodorum (strain SN15 / ATCC MYA-4574 / FGSC 10173) TaxID=321614 RepID=A0A7U2FFK9_PHANO|nr:hypothetical protein SNOG_16127 [Parastagonospora nodorum SN15]KAH3905085.1 hypothetical protein HBH56_223640 [Parastagonospora nodorum]EAT76499.1 hypothetical protein SNOG_16127 [Parastagonospora nodorum SN15]KAH3921932.1 hypothetical protein HBH54_231790 [Parastagonospora nodorum]KAH3959972.1 hypothetical protein HBH52_240990 [Parastagonospora nodorum]KAH3991751.1 hypothetical protein HBI10_228060 [Parastagonospora nodorum]
MFDDPTLSNIKIKQISNGKTREYFRHKARLCADSDFFINSFTIGFKEASNTAVEVHDNDPDHFESALKFIYTLDYDF